MRLPPPRVGIYQVPYAEVSELNGNRGYLVRLWISQSLNRAMGTRLGCTRETAVKDQLSGVVCEHLELL